MNAEYLRALAPQEQVALQENHFDRVIFEALWERYRGGDWTPGDNEMVGDVQAPEPGAIAGLPPRESPRGRRLIEVGRLALARGEVGALVLNGGMATRFGGAVKGCVEVFDGKCFLGLKLADATRHGEQVQVLLMNSFATAQATVEHLEEQSWYGFPQKNVLAFTQNVSLRLTPQGQIFRPGEGDTLYAPGHGDVAEATRRGALDEFQRRGGKYLLMSNVDNVLATLDPLLVGLHVQAYRDEGVEMTAEVVDNQGSATGGMPARVEGSLQILEAFRFPRGFDVAAIPVYNTNTFLFTARALERTFDLDWFVVEKEVGDERAIQFERLAGQLSAFLKTRFVQVPRQGMGSRFLPIKHREDLEQNRDFLRRVLK
jgi:UTP--glucose-1-phosphate uridylyltransferase